MKTLPSLLLALALASATATAASAYSLSPPDITAKLHGTLTLTPNEGGGTAFKCKVTMHLHTNGWIRAIKVDGPGNCGGVTFQDLPWRVIITGANSGGFGVVSFSSSQGNCQQDGVTFTDNSSGVFTLQPGQCLSGTLTSTPPVTIVP